MFEINYPEVLSVLLYSTECLQPILNDTLSRGFLVSGSYRSLYTLKFSWKSL